MVNQVPRPTAEAGPPSPRSPLTPKWAKPGSHDGDTMQARGTHKPQDEKGKGAPQTGTWVANLR